MDTGFEGMIYEDFPMVMKIKSEVKKGGQNGWLRGGQRVKGHVDGKKNMTHVMDTHKKKRKKKHVFFFSVSSP